MTALEIAAEAYRKAQLEFEAADAGEKLAWARFEAERTAFEAAHTPVLVELGKRAGAASDARTAAGDALRKALWALGDAAKGTK